MVYQETWVSLLLRSRKPTTLEKAYALPLDPWKHKEKQHNFIGAHFDKEPARSLQGQYVTSDVCNRASIQMLAAAQIPKKFCFASPDFCNHLKLFL